MKGMKGLRGMKGMKGEEDTPASNAFGMHE
jgi:hypothetical protein